MVPVGTRFEGYAGRAAAPAGIRLGQAGDKRWTMDSDQVLI
jgi:hypothetical protein